MLIRRPSSKENTETCPMQVTATIVDFDKSLPGTGATSKYAIGPSSAIPLFI
jgi:hypothetical protein